MQDILSRFSPGFRFDPTGEQLISYYLARKVHGRLTPEETDMIKVCNILYGEGARPPWEIFKLAGHKGGDDALYFFTTLIKKTRKSGARRMSRTVGTDGGTWHGDGVEEVTCRLDNREFKGTKRRFRYQNNQRPDQNGCWNLLEYGSESISDNIVICKLKISEHGLKESRKRKSMRPLAGTVSNEDNGGCSATGDTFYSIQNIGPMTAAYENQQMEPASYNGGVGVCPAGDNAVTPENAAPAVSAIPVMDACLTESLNNETSWSANFEALPDFRSLWSPRWIEDHF